MIDPWSAAGALLLSTATLPQAWVLLRGRSAEGFAWPFVLLNLAGLVLLAARSGRIGEWSFLAVNVVGALFWLLVLVKKAHEASTLVRSARCHRGATPGTTRLGPASSSPRSCRRGA